MSGTENPARAVGLNRIGSRAFRALNERGGAITIGAGGENTDFTPVELLLAAVAACSAMDVDVATTRSVRPGSFLITASAVKESDDSGNKLNNIEVSFDVRFPEGEAGDKARAVLPRAVSASHDKYCTVSRTIESGTSVKITLNS